MYVSVYVNKADEIRLVYTDASIQTSNLNGPHRKAIVPVAASCCSRVCGQFRTTNRPDLEGSSCARAIAIGADLLDLN